MNVNNKNVDPMQDVEPNIKHLLQEISENVEVYYRLEDVAEVLTSSSCFFVSKSEEGKL